MGNNKNRLAPFFTQIGIRIKELNSGIALTVYETLQAASIQPLDETSLQDMIPPELEIVLSQHTSPEMSILKELAHTLPWTPSKTIAKESPKLRKLAAVELIGPSGVVTKDNFRLGLLIQPASTHYPKHRHAAEELYLVLSGTALWGQGKAGPTPRKPGSFCHHRSWEWHEMITSDEPLLSLWCWTGDIRFDQYQIFQVDNIED